MTTDPPATPGPAAAPGPGPAARPHRVDEAWPVVAGRPGLTQGVYGERGNLELVGCDPDDGLWVGWFNLDTAEARAGAARSQWSGGLRFGRGRRFTEAAVTQVDAGPHWLEVIALTDSHEARRLVWSPGDGFVDHGVVAAEVESVLRLVVTADGEHVVALRTQTGVRLLRGRPGPAYPVLDLSAQERSTGDATALDTVAHDGHLDLLLARQGTVLLDCGGDEHRVANGTGGRLMRDEHGWTAVVRQGGSASVHDEQRCATRLLGAIEDVEIASVRLDGLSTWHVASRGGGRLVHHRLRDDVATAEPVVARVWVDGEDPPTVHRE